VGLYSKPPFTTIARLMEKEGLSTTDLGAFLRWKAKDDNMKVARAEKANNEGVPRRQIRRRMDGRSSFSKKWKQSVEF
jgi:hypothetical protein